MPLVPPDVPIEPVTVEEAEQKHEGFYPDRNVVRITAAMRHLLIALAAAMVAVAATAQAIPLSELRSQEAERRNIEAALKAYQKLPHPSREADKADKTIDRMLHHYIAGQQQDVQFCKRELAHADADERADIVAAIAGYESKIMWAQRIVNDAANFEAALHPPKRLEQPMPQSTAKPKVVHHEGLYRVTYKGKSPTNVQIVKSSGDPHFDSYAVQTLSTSARCDTCEPDEESSQVIPYGFDDMTPEQSENMRKCGRLVCP